MNFYCIKIYIKNFKIKKIYSLKFILFFWKFSIERKYNKYFKQKTANPWNDVQDKTSFGKRTYFSRKNKYYTSSIKVWKVQNKFPSTSNLIFVLKRTLPSFVHYVASWMKSTYVSRRHKISLKLLWECGLFFKKKIKNVLCKFTGDEMSYKIASLRRQILFKQIILLKLYSSVQIISAYNETIIYMYILYIWDHISIIFKNIFN